MSDLLLKIRVVEAHGLHRDDTFGSSGTDPFIIAKFKGLGKILSSVQSSVIHNTVNPVWNEDFSMFPKSESDVLYLKVYDHDSLSKDNLLGMVEVPLEAMFQKGVQDIWLQLMRRRGAWKSIIGGHPTWVNVAGQLHIKLWFDLSSQATGLNCPKTAPQIYHQLQGQYTPTSHFFSAIFSSSSSSSSETFKSGYHPITSPYTSPSNSSSQLLVPPAINIANNIPQIQVQ